MSVRTVPRHQPHTSVITALIVLVTAAVLGLQIWAAVTATASTPANSSSPATSLSPANSSTTAGRSAAGLVETQLRAPRRPAPLPRPIPTLSPTPSAGPTVPAPAPVPVPSVSPGVTGTDAQQGLFSPFNAPDSHGVKLLSYDFMANSPGRLDINGNATYAIGSWAWTANVYIIGVSEWLLREALSFKLALELMSPAGQLAAAYRGNVIAQVGLTGFFLLLSVALSMAKVMRGHRSRGFSEYLISGIIAAVGVSFLASPATTLLGPNGPFSYARDAGTVVAGIAYAGTTDPAATATRSSDDIADQVVGQLGDTFVRLPHELINYGHQLDGGPCNDQYEEIVTKGPWGTKGDPRDMLGHCGRTGKDAAAYNGDSLTLSTRSVGAILTMLTGLLVSLFVIVMSVGLLLAQVTMAVAVVAGVFVVPFGVVPGFGRALLARWVGVVLAAGLAVVATLGVFGLFLQGVQLMAGDKLGLPLITRFLLMGVVTIAAFIGRHKAMRAVNGWSHKFAERTHGALSALGGGGSGRALPAAALAGAAGYGAVDLAQKHGRSALRVTGTAGRAVGAKALNGRDALYSGVGSAAPAVAGGIGAAAGAATGGIASGARRSAPVAKAAVRRLAQLGVGVATGGSSAAVLAAGKVATAARHSAQVAGALRQAQQARRSSVPQSPDTAGPGPAGSASAGLGPGGQLPPTLVTWLINRHKK